MALVVLLLALCIPLLGLATVYPSLRNPARFMPPAPSDAWHFQRTREMIERLFPQGARVCELGSGWGGFARRMGVIRVPVEYTGVDVNLFLLWLARRRSQPGARFLHMDAFSVDLSPYDVVLCYMDRSFNVRLLDHLRRHPEWCGKLLVTYQFPTPGLLPVEQDSTRFLRWFAYRL